VSTTLRPDHDSRSQRLASVLNRPIFKIDELACLQAADAIRAYRARVEATPWGHFPRASQLTFKLAFVAICHQFNWDFMQERLARHLLTADPSEMVRRLVRIRADDFNEWVTGYNRPHRIKAAERAEMLRAIGSGLQQKFDGDVLTLVSRASGKLEGATGFLQQLDAFEPYRADPLRKKSNVLVQDLVRERIVNFEDETTIRPAVDYHIMRLYLRTGRVVPMYTVVADALKGMPRPRPRLVKLLREAVAEALQTTAGFAKLSVAEINYVEWQIGRSICHRLRPLCTTPAGKVELDPDIAALFDGPCPYASFCPAYRDSEWRRLSEPNLVSRFY
jgi:hypothetical protein